MSSQVSSLGKQVPICTGGVLRRVFVGKVTLPRSITLSGSPSPEPPVLNPEPKRSRRALKPTSFSDRRIEQHLNRSLSAQELGCPREPVGTTMCGRSVWRPVENTSTPWLAGLRGLTLGDTPFGIRSVLISVNVNVYIPLDRTHIPQRAFRIRIMYESEGERAGGCMGTEMQPVNRAIGRSFSLPQDAEANTVLRA